VSPGRVLLKQTRSLPHSHYTAWHANAREGTWVRADTVDSFDDDDGDDDDGLNGGLPLDQGEWLQPEVIDVPVPPHLQPGETFTALVQPRASLWLHSNTDFVPYAYQAPAHVVFGPPTALAADYDAFRRLAYGYPGHASPETYRPNDRTWLPMSGGVASGSGRQFAIADGRVLRALEAEAAREARAQPHSTEAGASCSPSLVRFPCSCRPRGTLPEPTAVPFFFLRIQRQRFSAKYGWCSALLLDRTRSAQGNTSSLRPALYGTSARAVSALR